MHNIKDCCKLIKFNPVDFLDEITSNFLEESFEVVTINYTDDGLEEYVCYAPLDFNLNTFKELAQKQNITLPDFKIETLENKDWLTENVIKFSPFEIGEFLIYGIHETSTPPTSKIPVQVYAATAFGSEHQTTKMCLTAISELHSSIPLPTNILDMGTGSGILSIAASKIWQNNVNIIAADIDAQSVDVTHSNTITNSVETYIKAIHSDGYSNPIIKENAPFDIIFANILLNPLKAMANDAYQMLSTNGYYLISGFIDNQEQDIINHHTSLGFKLLKTYALENWRAAILQKI